MSNGSAHFMCIAANVSKVKTGKLCRESRTVQVILASCHGNPSTRSRVVWCHTRATSETPGSSVQVTYSERCLD